ncbi:MAG: arylsulfatase A-like enzyme [Kiritimatiellia bacterium]|jgi:arylsulfatase A-like enzyme
MKKCWIGLCFLLVATVLADKPNVLFIAVDDLNDWIGCLGGHPQAKTPNIDRLAERGVLFEQAYCAAPACNPSRAALMTGIRPSTSGIYHNPTPWRGSPVLKHAVTLPQHFSAHGYRSIGTGKIYHGAFPDPASWDVYWPSKTKTRPNDPMPDGRPLAGVSKSHFDWGPVDVPDAEMADTQVVDWAIEQLGMKHDQPLFLACGIFRPHLPWYVPPKYFEPFPLAEIILPTVPDNDLDDIPDAGKKMAKPEGDHKSVLGKDQWKTAVQAYLASIYYTDTQVGRLLDALDASAYKDNTIICFWTDHGWHLGEKKHWRKFSLWEEAARTPLIFVAPGVTRPGQRCIQPVNLLDIYPTLNALCGLPDLKVLEGQSLLPLLKDVEASLDRVSITTHGRGNHGVRSKDFRYIRYADGSEELYDHRKDPNEWTNQASNPEFATVAKRLRAKIPEVNVPEHGAKAKKRRK